MQVILQTNDFYKANTKGISLGKWTPGSHINLFPDKLSNLMGKEIKLATLDYPPYSMLQPVEDGNELRTLAEFCRKFNCTVTLVTDDHLWGEIFSNETGIGVSGNVYMDKADVGIGAVYLWDEEFKFLDYSKPYTMTRVTALVPQPKRYPEWQIPILPFSFTMWVLQLFSTFFATIVLFLINAAAVKIYTVRSRLQGEFATLGGTFLRATAMSVLQPPPSRLPPGSPLRSFFTTFEVLFLFFTTIYAGSLSSVLTVPLYYPAIDNPKAMYESGIRWGADHEAWIFSLRSATEPHMKGLLSRFETHKSSTLIELTKAHDFGLSIEIMEGGHVTETKHLSGELIIAYHVMKQELYTTYCVAYLRKGSPYLAGYNRILDQIVDGGLLLLWETEVTLKHLSSRLQVALKLSQASRIEVHEPTVLKMSHVQGAFIFLAMGECLSLMVFIFEVFRPSLKKIFKSE